MNTYGDAPAARRRGAPRDLTEWATTASPFARYSELAGAGDATMSGWTDHRRTLPPAQEIKVPHHVTIYRGTEPDDGEFYG